MRSTVHARTRIRSVSGLDTNRLPLWICSPGRQHQTNTKHQAMGIVMVHDPLPLLARMAGACMHTCRLAWSGYACPMWLVLVLVLVVVVWVEGQEQGEG